MISINDSNTQRLQRLHRVVLNDINVSQERIKTFHQTNRIFSIKTLDPSVEMSQDEDYGVVADNHLLDKQLESSNEQLQRELDGLCLASFSSESTIQVLQTKIKKLEEEVRKANMELLLKGEEPQSKKKNKKKKKEPSLEEQVRQLVLGQEKQQKRIENLEKDNIALKEANIALIEANILLREENNLQKNVIKVLQQEIISLRNRVELLENERDLMRSANYINDLVTTISIRFGKDKTNLEELCDCKYFLAEFGLERAEFKSFLEEYWVLKAKRNLLAHRTDLIDKFVSSESRQVIAKLEKK